MENYYCTKCEKYIESNEVEPVFEKSYLVEHKNCGGEVRVSIKFNTNL